MTQYAVSNASARAWFTREIVATFAFSWPIVPTNLAVNLMSTTDVIFLGRLSPESLAAGALGHNLYMPVFLFCVGVIGAVTPIAASLIGADSDERGRAALPSGAAQFAAARLAGLGDPLERSAILRAIGEPPDLATNAGLYIHGLQWAVAPCCCYFRAVVFAALSRTGRVLVASLIAVGFNALANYALIFGHFGAPQLGMFGSGIATSCRIAHVFIWPATPLSIRACGGRTASLAALRAFTRPSRNSGGWVCPSAGRSRPRFPCSRRGPGDGPDRSRTR